MSAMPLSNTISITDFKSEIQKAICSKYNEAHQNTRTFLHIDNVVYNQSSLTFTTDELLLLNKGLKFALLSVKPPIEELATAIQYDTTFSSVPVKQEVIPFSTCI